MLEIKSQIYPQGIIVKCIYWHWEDNLLLLYSRLCFLRLPRFMPERLSPATTITAQALQMLHLRTFLQDQVWAVTSLMRLLEPYLADTVDQEQIILSWQGLGASSFIFEGLSLRSKDERAKEGRTCFLAMLFHSTHVCKNLRPAPFQGLQFTRKGLQSRSATASLLIKDYQCMKEEIKLIVFLAQKSRHCWSLQEEIGTHKFFGERPRVDGCSEKGRVAHLVQGLQGLQG